MQAFLSIILKQVYLNDKHGVLITGRGVATDMATMDSAWYLSQIVLSLMMGPVVEITGSVRSYMVASGLVGLLSCIFIPGIITSKENIQGYSS
jgi:solute carrier family 45 protein 3